MPETIDCRTRTFSKRVSAFELSRILYPRLREAHRALEVERRQSNATKAPQFNLFRVLRLENDEVRLHSKLLGHFLNPRGFHGQGTLFLDTFLLCATKKLREPLPLGLNTSGWRVSTEKFTIKGNLDIVLEGGEDRVLCVIENKIRAEEGDEQLDRYRAWLDLQRKFTHRLLFYLTPDGRGSDTVAKDDGYIRLSYREHVRSWLKKTIPQIQARQVKVIAQQYLDVVEDLELGL